MTQKKLGCLGVFVAVILCLSLALNFLFVLGKGTSVSMGKAPQFDESTVVEAQPDAEGKQTDDKIALLHLRGIITSAEPGSLGETMVDDLKIQLKQAADDKNVKAIVLHIDSPGGEVTASDIIYNAVRRVRDDSKKPVVIYMGSLAASGGFYVACGGSWLMANETTLTGSIGVIMQTINYEGLLGKVGVAPVTFKSGAFKDMLSGSRPMTDVERDYVQGLVMQTYDKFVGIVARERKLDEQTLRTGLADGRVISGKDAETNKLINSLGEIEDAYAKAMELAKIKTAAVIRYDSGFKLGRVLKMLGKSEAKAAVEVKLAESFAPKLEAGRLYFLPSFYAP